MTLCILPCGKQAKSTKDRFSERTQRFVPKFCSSVCAERGVMQRMEVYSPVQERNSVKQMSATVRPLADDPR